MSDVIRFRFVLYLLLLYYTLPDCFPRYSASSLTFAYISNLLVLSFAGLIERAWISGICASQDVARIALAPFIEVNVLLNIWPCSVYLWVPVHLPRKPWYTTFAARVNARISGGHTVRIWKCVTLWRVNLITGNMLALGSQSLFRVQCWYQPTFDT